MLLMKHKQNQNMMKLNGANNGNMKNEKKQRQNIRCRCSRGYTRRIHREMCSISNGTWRIFNCSSDDTFNEIDWLQWRFLHASRITVNYTLVAGSVDPKPIVTPMTVIGNINWHCKKIIDWLMKKSGYSRLPAILFGKNRYIFTHLSEKRWTFIQAVLNDVTVEIN